MNNSGLKYLILMLSNCVVYSVFYFLFNVGSTIDVIWSISLFIILGITYVKLTELLLPRLKNKREIIFLILLCVLLLIITGLAFTSSSELQTKVKGLLFLTEIILLIVVLRIYYWLNKNALSEKVDLKDNVDFTNIDYKEVYDYVKNVGNPLEKRNQIKAALWIVICCIIIGFTYFILPIFMKMLKADKEKIMFAYLLFLLLTFVTLLRKNYLFYKGNIKPLFITVVEFFGICIACIVDAYWNVYLYNINLDSHVIYFGPYLLLGLGIIPFLLNANKITKKYGSIMGK